MVGPQVILGMTFLLSVILGIVTSRLLLKSAVGVEETKQDFIKS